MSEQFEGWSNQFTWLVNLHWNNMYDDYKYWSARALDIYTNAKDTIALNKIQVATDVLSEEMEESLKYHNPLSEKCNMYSDLMSKAISSVDTYEIAKDWIHTTIENLK